MMKWNRIRFYNVLLITGLAFGLAQAASLSSSDLPSGSNWYVHVNLDLIQNSEIGRQLMLGTVDEVLEEVQEEMNIDLRDEIEGITAFGGGMPVNGSSMSDGAVILHGPISMETQESLLSALDNKGATVTTSYENSLAYYSVENDGTMTHTDEDGVQKTRNWDNHEALYFSFGDSQALITQSREMMQTFLDAGGYLGGFESVDSDALLVLQADRALMQGGANTSVGIGDDWDSSVLKNVDAVALVIAEEQGGLQISAQLTANTPEVAMSVRNIAEGLVALKALDESDSEIGDILRTVHFQNDGPVLHVDVSLAADQIDALKDL